MVGLSFVLVIVGRLMLVVFDAAMGGKTAPFYRL